MKLVTGPFQLELSPTRAVDSEDWVRVGAAIAVAGFTGNFEAWLQLEDLRRFIRELEVMYAAVGTPRTAELTSAEPDIRVRLQSQPLGGILGNYRLESERRDGVATALSGSFELDQTFLPDLAESVQSLILALGERHVALYLPSEPSER